MIKNKIKHIAETYKVSVEWVWNEFDKLSNIQMTEERKWDYIVSLILKMKGYV